MPTLVSVGGLQLCNALLKCIFLAAGVLPFLQNFVHTAWINVEACCNAVLKLTDVARRIIQDTDPESEKRKQAIRTSALMPSIHKELWESFGSPDRISDSVLRNHLLFDRVDSGEAPYSEASASEVIQTYRDALLFAGVTAPDIPDTAEYDELHIPEVAEVRGPANLASPTQKPFNEPSHAQRNSTIANIAITNEIEWMRSKLGSDTVVRIISNRDLGPREIGKLIKLLQAQQSVLEEDDDGSTLD